jgi:adenylate kinase
MKYFALIGAPGVGKGTFAQIISQRLSLQHISVGDILRNLVKQQNQKKSTKLAQELSSYMREGKLIPDHLICDIVFHEISSSQSILLDGFPRYSCPIRSTFLTLVSILFRTLSQATFLSKSLPNLNVLHIKLNKHVAIQKLLGRRSCNGCGGNFNVANVMNDDYLMPAILPNPDRCPLGPEQCKEKQQLVLRSDDTESTIATRFDIFETEMAPILEFYRGRNQLKEFVVKKGVDDSEDLIKLMMRS